jgi:periplasmic mercuric ion binding protein
MRQLVLAAAALVAVAAWGAGTAQAGKVEIKGVHVCCKNCAAAINGVLAKVDGVNDVVAKAKEPVAFTTKDDKTTTAALTALSDAGFLGTATDDGKEVKIELTSPKKGDKADEITITSTHACCGMCQKAIKAALADATSVEFPDKSTVKVTGKDLDKAAVLDALRKIGYNGKIDK